ncbi:hypothetical protein [Brevibacillus centrosporus]|uniref:hypothetical protein n=1 Tax=Brevibacillus centrosporus TaxID=54910 RepID=UPI003B022054
MRPEEMMMEWLYWHHAVEYMKQDLPKLEAADSLRFPLFAGWVLRQLGSQAYAKEQEAAKELRANGIRVVKEKVDRGEVFVVWSHRGNTDIFRIRERELRAEVQKKIDELMTLMIEHKQGELPRE